MAAEHSVTGSSTAEYRTVCRLAKDLQLAFKNDLTTLSLLLQGTTPVLLTADNAAVLRNRVHPAFERAATLVGYIQDKVESDSTCYHAVVKVLKRNFRYYSSILQKLNATFQEEGGRVEPNDCPQAPLEGVVENLLESKDLGTLLKLLHPVAAHWDLIAPHLNPPLKNGTVSQIRADTCGKPGQSKHCLREMLSKWLKQVTPCRPSWQNLRTAIDNAMIEGGDLVIQDIDKQILMASQ